MFALLLCTLLSSTPPADLMQGKTRIGDDEKIGITVTYWVIPKPKPATYRKLFKPADTSNDYDTNARYLYLYQAQNDSGLKGSLEDLHIRWKGSMDLITSWGHLPDTAIQVSDKEEIPYLRVSGAYNVDKIRLVSDEPEAELSRPDDVANTRNYLRVNWDDGVKTNGASSAFGFTSDYPPTFTQVTTTQSDLLGTVPVPYSNNAVTPGVYQSSLSASPLTNGSLPMLPLAPTSTLPVPAEIANALSGMAGYGSQGIGRIAKEKSETQYRTRTEVVNDCCNEAHIVPEPPYWIYAAFCVLYLILVARTSFRLRTEK